MRRNDYFILSIASHALFSRQLREGPARCARTKIAEAENVPLDVVREYVRHRIFLECEKALGSARNVGSTSLLGVCDNV